MVSMKLADLVAVTLSVMITLCVPIPIVVGTTNLNGVKLDVAPPEGTVVTLLLVTAIPPIVVLVAVFRVAPAV
jgi:hypothetical protein